MDQKLMHELIVSLLQGRQMATQLLSGSGMSIVELIALAHIENNREDSDDNIYADDLGAYLYISKPAISQMLKSLETRGFIVREINPQNRRKLTVTLTDAGRELLARTKAYMARMLTEITEAFGEEKVRAMVALYDEFSDVVRTVARCHAATEADVPVQQG